MVLCGTAAAADRHYKFNLVSTSGDRESPNGKAVRRFSERVAEASDGRIRVNVFYSSELGGQGEVFDHLMKGNVHFMLEWPMTSYDQRLAIGMLPYSVLGWDDAIKAYSKDGWLRQIFERVFAENGLRYFGPFPEGFGGIATRGKYATRREQAAGLKVRSQTIFPLPQVVQAMGFESVPIDWSEVYTSIQTGVVDGDSGNVIYWDYQYFGDLLDYYVHCKQVFGAAAFVMNAQAYADMAPEDQQIVDAAAQQMVSQQFIDARSTDEYWIKTAQENGMQYIVPSDADMQRWVQQVRDEVWPQAEVAYGKEIMDIIRANASVPE
ncbi:MAG: TRAP transporter substrate-binding protein DctP [Gammaproteobacteria bacterium]|nr:TRAP transporter substrate-binding protein DctP [Gammaproteobacteria bacterium]